MFYSLKSPYRVKASFVTNDVTIKELRKLKDKNDQYLWQPSIREGTPDTIVGKPIHTSEFMPQIAAGVKALAFGDYSPIIGLPTASPAHSKGSTSCSRPRGKSGSSQHSEWTASCRSGWTISVRPPRST